MSKASQKPCLRPFETLGLAEEKEKEEEEAQAREKKKEEGKEEEVLEEEQEKCLNRFEKGFNTWLSGLYQVQLEKVVKILMEGHHNEKTTQDYIAFVKSHNLSVRFCSKCRYAGCEKCSYLHCLRHVVRHQIPGEWWLRSSQIAVEGSLRFLNRA